MSGFSLLELILALTILSLMAGLIYSSLRLSLNSYDKAQERLEVEARQRVLMDQIRRQIGSLFPVRPSGSFLDAEVLELEEQAQPVQVYSQIPLFYGTPESVTFVTVAPLMMHEHPGLTVVRYGLSQDEYGNYYLGAMETRYMGFESFMSMVRTPRGKPLPLVERVRDLEFEYYGYDPGSQQYGWFSGWIGEEVRAVPDAIRIHYDDNQITVAVNASFSGSQGTRAMRQFLQTR